MKSLVYVSAFCALMLFSCQKNEPSPASANQQPDYVSGQYYGQSESIIITVSNNSPNPEKRDTTYKDSAVAIVTKRGDSISFNIDFLPSLVNNVTMKYVDSNHYIFSGYGSHFFDNVDVYLSPSVDSIVVKYHKYNGGSGGSNEGYYTFLGKK